MNLHHHLLFPIVCEVNIESSLSKTCMTSCDGDRTVCDDDGTVSSAGVWYRGRFVEVLLFGFDFRELCSYIFDDAALLCYGLFQVCDEPCDFVEVCASSFASARELEARGFVGCCECSCVVSASFVSPSDPPELRGRG